MTSQAAVSTRSDWLQPAVAMVLSGQIDHVSYRGMLGYYTTALLYGPMISKVQHFSSICTGWNESEPTSWTLGVGGGGDLGTSPMLISSSVSASPIHSNWNSCSDWENRWTAWERPEKRAERRSFLTQWTVATHKIDNQMMAQVLCKPQSVLHGQAELPCNQLRFRVRQMCLDSPATLWLSSSATFLIW